MSQDGRPPTRFRYTRDGETLTVGFDGVTLTGADGTVRLNLEHPMPDDVVASTVVDLAVSGWTPTPDPAELS